MVGPRIDDPRPEGPGARLNQCERLGLPRLFAQGIFGCTHEEVAIMTQRKKRAMVRKSTPTARGKVRKASKSWRGKSAKRSAAKATPEKRAAKLKSARAGVRKVARKKATKPPATSVVETVITDVAEDPVPAAITITEFEETKVREEGEGPETPEETPESEER
jgi:hypothetical protein